MPKYQKHKKISPETQAEAIKIAKGSQRPGQTKEQTKLIAQGIEKGINQYKKQQKAKSRELNKKTHKAASKLPAQQPNPKEQRDSNLKYANKTSVQTALPWILLLLSWAGFAGYIISD